MKTFATVCSGIGAPELAFSRRGWRPLFGAEIEKFPCAVLKHHYPHTPNFGDLAKHHEWKIPTNPDVLIAGTPCQAFSVAGLRKGLADPRGNLTLTFLGLIEQCAPRWVVWENVPGVLSDKSGAFGCFLGGLAQLGYGFAYRVLDAQYYGVAQRRRRVFVVAHLGGLWQRAAAVLFERDSLCGHTPPRRQTGQGTAPTISARTKGGGGLGTDCDCDGGLIEITHSLRADGFDASEDGTGRGTPLVPECVAHGQGNAEHVRDGEPSLTCNHEAPILFEPIPIQEIGKRQSGTALNGVGHGAPGDPMYTLQSAAQHGVAIGKDARAGRMRGREGCAGGGKGPLLSEEQSLTLAANANDQVLFQEATAFTQNQAGDVLTGSVMASMGTSQNATGRNTPKAQVGMSVRRLTPRECERLQGFPDDYTLIDYRGKPACDGPRYKALGNSMAVPVIEWLGHRIDLVDELAPLVNL